jgi:hypothetical protein
MQILLLLPRPGRVTFHLRSLLSAAGCYCCCWPLVLLRFWLLTVVCTAYDGERIRVSLFPSPLLFSFVSQPFALLILVKRSPYYHPLLSFVLWRLVKGVVPLFCPLYWSQLYFLLSLLPPLRIVRKIWSCRCCDEPARHLLRCHVVTSPITLYHPLSPIPQPYPILL